LTEFLSRAPLLIGLLQVAAFGLLIGLVGLYFARRERLASMHQAAAANAKDVNPENSKPAHA
jgi:hypothetical protein